MGGTTVNIVCPSNATYSASRTCNATGQWLPPTGSGCNCPQDGIWNATATDTYIVMDCPNGQQQAWSRYCSLAGAFGPIISNCSCPVDAEWNITLPGVYATIPCPYQVLFSTLQSVYVHVIKCMAKKSIMCKASGIYRNITNE